MNACGRMGKAELALQMLLTENNEEAVKIAEKLQIMNRERQEIEKVIMQDAVQMIETNHLEKDNVIIVGNENWHHGVIGIVSSKITDMYSKPSILLCFEDDIAKGSGRSVQGFDLHEALENCSTYIKQFGGHSMAVGITVEKENFANFKNELEEYANKMDVSSIIPVIKIDEKIKLQDISIKDIKDLDDQFEKIKINIEHIF